MALRIEHLGKTYGDGKRALHDLNLEIGPGVFGLLGPNGAGKSTLLQILSLNLQPTDGRVFWGEKLDMLRKPRKTRKLLGYLPQDHGAYPELPAQVWLECLGRLHGLGGRKLQRRIDECLEMVRLTEQRGEKIGGYSGGMRQRLAIAQSLLHDPELLIVDEPTTGLDPIERVAFRNLLFDLGQGHVVLLCTHIVKDVEFTCNRMAILYGGMRRFCGLPAEFMQAVEGRVYEQELGEGELAEFRERRHVVAITETPETMQVRFIVDKGESTGGARRVERVNLEDAYVDFIRQVKQQEAAHGVGN